MDKEKSLKINEEKPSIKSLNDLLYDNDLSIEELEERLELDPWFCGVYCNENSGCNPIGCSPIGCTQVA